MAADIVAGSMREVPLAARGAHRSRTVNCNAATTKGQTDEGREIEGRGSPRRLADSFGAEPIAHDIEFRPAEVSETKDLDENTILDLDAVGNICSMTIEHASLRADIPHFSFEQVAA